MTIRDFSSKFDEYFFFCNEQISSTCIWNEWVKYRDFYDFHQNLNLKRF